MGQLEPCTRKGIGKCIEILIEPFSYLAIFRIHLHRHIGVGHHGIVVHGGILNIGWLIFFPDIDRFPLPRTGRAFLQFPFVIEQQLEVAIVPLDRVGGPSAFKAACDGIAADTAFGFIDPSQALVFKACSLGFRL